MHTELYKTLIIQLYGILSIPPVPISDNEDLALEIEDNLLVVLSFSPSDGSILITIQFDIPPESVVPRRKSYETLLQYKGMGPHTEPTVESLSLVSNDKAALTSSVRISSMNPAALLERIKLALNEAGEIKKLLNS